MVVSIAEMSKLARVLSQQADRLMIERGIGYWIDPDGQMIPTPPRVSHADVARELISEQGLNDDEKEQRLIDVNAFAVSQGWTRVRIYPSQSVTYVDFGADRRETHRRLVEDLIEQLGFVDMAVKYTDEEGNYVSP